MKESATAPFPCTRIGSDRICHPRSLRYGLLCYLIYVRYATQKYMTSPRGAGAGNGFFPNDVLLVISRGERSVSV